MTTDLRLNEPRYASLPNIMKAKKKPLDEKTPERLGVDVAPRLKVLKTVEPAGRKAGVKVASVAELVEQAEERSGSALRHRIWMTRSSSPNTTTRICSDATAKALDRGERRLARPSMSSSPA